MSVYRTKQQADWDGTSSLPGVIPIPVVGLGAGAMFDLDYYDSGKIRHEEWLRNVKNYDGPPDKD